jgi:hypothetical protein
MTDAPEGFTRTLQIASDKEAQANVLDRAFKRAKSAGAYDDARKLEAMARELRDYAAALRETAQAGPPVVEDEHGALQL